MLTICNYSYRRERNDDKGGNITEAAFGTDALRLHVIQLSFPAIL